MLLVLIIWLLTKKPKVSRNNLYKYHIMDGLAVVYRFIFDKGHKNTVDNFKLVKI